MNFRVVCISRAVAAGGEGIGQAVAQRLGFRCIDEQIITRAAQQAQIDPKLVEAAEHRRPLMQRLLDKLAQAQELAGPAALATGLPLDIFAPVPGGGYHASEDDLRVLIRAAIHEMASVGRVVIVAHAASMALAGTEGVLRVLVTASPEIRAQRLAATQGLSATDASAAIAKSDRERRDYFQRFYNIKEELPTHYDLVVNTDVLHPDQAVAVIAAAAECTASSC
ncbi:MAG TPA: cytidylate kinase-like family protein [Candidatus Kryptonia bacterium]|nr:cytidylate kinase-like family protein [Candidatus Kryptonia bacterium]